ncbi:MAG: DUF2147 domain-containing protein [Bacteroidales bacterium]|nr:DUF2147 domain-containing protein [Bacteroidales bacterium]
MNKLLLFVMVTVCSIAAAQNADSILGKQFYRADKKAIVTFYRQTDSTYCARTTWLKEPNDKNGKPRTDKYNPSQQLRQRPLIGMNVMYDLTYHQGIYSGIAYHPAHGLTCKVDLQLTREGNLKIVGYKWGLRKSEIWQNALNKIE